MRDFLDAFVREHCKHTYPGREFAVLRGISDLEGWTIQELGTQRFALIPRSLWRLRPCAEDVREMARIIDKAFYTRSEIERLPWQMFAVAPGGDL